MDGKRFLGTARFLQNSGSDEAAYRSAVSRAYFACFLEARQVAFDHCSGEAKRKARVTRVGRIRHQPLQQYLKNSPCTDIRQLGEDLAGLSGNRNDADYNMEDSLSADDSQGAIDEAQAFLDALSRIAPVEIGSAMEEDIEQTYR